MDLLSNANATGASKTWGGGPGVFQVAGTFGGATVSLEQLGPDATTWLTVHNGGDLALTAAASRVFVAPPGQLRAAVSGGSPSGLYATVNR